MLSNARSIDSTVEANYVYFRIRTNVFENVEKIEEILGDLNTVPLDFEVKDGGCDNPLNMGTDEVSPWFYSMSPILTLNEVESLGEIEIIDEMIGVLVRVGGEADKKESVLNAFCYNIMVLNFF